MTSRIMFVKPPTRKPPKGAVQIRVTLPCAVPGCTRMVDEWVWLKPGQRLRRKRSYHCCHSCQD